MADFAQFYELLDHFLITRKPLSTERLTEVNYSILLLEGQRETTPLLLLFAR